MERNYFIKTLLGASIFTTMDAFSAIEHMMSNTPQDLDSTTEFATYGAIHLNVTNLERTTQFWTQIAGMKQRQTTSTTAEFGTETKTLVVVHKTAKTPFSKGYSGLYHVAIHAPSKQAFASMTQRVLANDYPFSPVDHTMSKSIYLDDPDGINIEFTLETPERFKRVITSRGLQIEDANGTIKSASAPLDIQEVLKDLVPEDVNKTIANGTYIGHLHLYANNMQESNVFYQKLGFTSFNYLPQFMYADLGAGGAYKHRIAMNSWHGMNRPLAPSECAGMNHFQILFKSQKHLKNALSNLVDFKETSEGFWCTDPTGNKLLLTAS